MELLEHNRTTYEELEEYVRTGKDCCVVNPCGSGKTSVMAEFVKAHKGSSKIIIFTKQKNAMVYYRSRDSVFLDIDIYTYSKMLKDYKSGHIDGYEADYYILDEAHYIGAEKWNNAFMHIYGRFKPIIIGFTATPQRFVDQGTDETIVTSFFSGNSAGNFTTRQLQKKGVFTEPEYILSLYDFVSDVEDRLERITESDIPDEQKDRYRNMLYKALDEWNKSSNPEAVMKAALPRYMYKENSNKILVYCSCIADIDDKRERVDGIIKSIFKGKTIRSYRYTSRDSEKVLTDFDSEDLNYIKVLYSVDKIMETIHMDDLNIVLMLRPSVSNRIITQQFGRMNSIGNKNRSLIIDMVNNLSNMGTANFLGGHGESDENGENGRLQMNLSHIMRFRSLFDAIDSALVKSPLYTYGNIRGSISALCRIYNKQYTDVKMLMQAGYTFENAFEAVPARKAVLSQEIFDGYEKIKDFTLNEEQKTMCKEYLPIVERYIKNHGIIDEDMIQELYMELFYRISKLDEVERKNITAHLINALTNRYIKLCRYEQIRQSYYVKERPEELNIAENADMCDEYCRKELVNRSIPWLLDTVSKNERDILLIRMGFISGETMHLEDVGKVYGVTRERIRQKEAKAIRKLKYSSRICYKERWLELLEEKWYDYSTETGAFCTLGK